MSKRVAKRWKSRSTMFACWNFYDLHQIKSHVYEIDDEKYTVFCIPPTVKIVWTWIIFLIFALELIFTKRWCIWDTWIGTIGYIHSISSNRNILIWCDFCISTWLFVTFVCLETMTFSLTSLNSFLKVKFHSRSPNCCNLWVNIGFLLELPSLK